MRKIYFLTRSYPPFQKHGGAQARLNQVSFLERNGFTVKVLLPNYSITKRNFASSSYTQTSKLFFGEMSRYMEKIGVIDDYLNSWVYFTFSKIKNTVKRDDIVIATSGGELGCYKLGVMLKEHTSCKLIFSSHDPVLGTTFQNGQLIGGSSRAVRDTLERKLLNYADAIITSSQTYTDFLTNKYADLSSRMHTLYFGYSGAISPKVINRRKKQINICYGGAFSSIQAPEILLGLLENKSLSVNIGLYFIGNMSGYTPLKNKHKEVTYIQHMPVNRYRQFLKDEIDYGFVSLTQDWLKLCIPSKIYEYIGLGIPILGCLPEGEAMKIINENNYGIASHYADFNDRAEEILNKVTSWQLLNKYSKTILSDRAKWHMDVTYKKLINIISNI